ncbi:MAG: phosphomannomutase [Alphaproteobacteria bacterium]|nr:phosphomannomutase [Alphaproteobacteria bacterium]
MSYTFNPTILREYDIRGQVDKNLSEKDAYALGRAFATYLTQIIPDQNQYTVCVGYDGRMSSPTLSGELKKGLTESGVNVISIGLGPTPMLYFSVKHFNADAGIMVTGSHNPSDYNGFKMTLNKSPVFGDAIQTIGTISKSGNLVSAHGSSKEHDIKNEYVERLIQDLELDRDLTIGWDAGNGAAGEILQMLIKKIPGKHHLIFEDIDGTFPNHHPDPTVDKNLIDLQNLVANKNCDLGIAFDGDGDRIGVVDENGTILRCDILMTIYARDVIAQNPKAHIIGDVKCSQVMFDEIARMGGTPVMWKTGHSLVKAKMRELNAPLAGELSGHIFFADKYYGFDDALYCSIRLLNALSETDGGLSTLTNHLPKLFNTPEIRIDVDEAEKFDLVPKVAESLKSKLTSEMCLDDIDGVRISTPDGWWLLRPSNTQDVLVARMESNSAEGLERLKKMAGDEVKKLGYTLSA